MANLFESLPEDLSALTSEELAAFVAAARERVAEVAASPSDFVNDERTHTQLMDETVEAVASIERAAAEISARNAALTAETPEDEADVAALAALAERTATLEVEEPVEPPVDEPVVEDPPVDPPVEEVPVEEPPADEVTAAAPPARKPLSRPSRSVRAQPVPETERVTLTAAAEGLGVGLGQSIPDEDALAEMLIRRRSQFGQIPEGTHGEQIPIARAEWSHLYDESRKLSDDLGGNWEKIEAVTASAKIKAELQRRREEGTSLTASGGLCAPVTPYYQLMMLSVADRPVRAALPAFNADRGGIKYARPASLSAVTTGVGIISAAQDAAGGTQATKTCQVIACPAFSETDIQVIYHCLQFGNLGARTFPELVAQWNSLTLAAHARTAETALLDGIAAASTAVTAGDLSLGASANLINQVMAAASAMRSRHRMDPDAVLRVLFPEWVKELFASDVLRTQFQRFDFTEAQFVAMLRDAGVEPSFYLDSNTGGSQVFGTQAAGALVTFPKTVVWYIFPEGSFLYLDGGTLELGLVRDSVLNKTNDFQLFGESFENVAFIGIESLKVTSTVQDSGTLSLAKAVADPYTY